MRESRNLLPNPKPTDTSAWKFYSQKDLRVQMLSDNRLHITNNANIPDSYIYTQLQLPAGVYRFGAEVSAPQGAYASNLLRVVIMPRTELTPATWDGTPGRVVTPANTVPEDSTVEFRVMVGPNANCAIWVRQLFVMTEEDYQQMIANNIAWFDGDGIVPGGGFLLAFSIHMWVAALLWWWSHEQAHHPTRRTAGHRLQKLRVHAVPGPAYDRPNHVRARVGCRRAAARRHAQPVRSGAHLQHGDAPEILFDERHVGYANHHASTVQHGHPYRPAGTMGRQPARAHIQHGRWLVRIAPVGAHAHERNGRDHAIQTPLGHGLEPLVSGLTLVPGLGVAA